MQTLMSVTTRDGLKDRLERLNADTPARWGRMTCPQMLAHVADALRMGLGQLDIAPKSGPLRHWPLKQAVIYWLPFPKGAPTARELLARPHGPIQEEKAAITSLIEEFAAKDAQTTWPDHPLFGRLSRKDWGVLAYKHLDHHLKQFGV